MVAWLVVSNEDGVEPYFDSDRTKATQFHWHWSASSYVLDDTTTVVPADAASG
jgi:hypothetical protein